MMTNDRVVTAPAAEPVTLAEAKTFLREVGADQDNLIIALISAARVYAENYTRRAFVTQERELTMDWFPGGSALEVGYGYGTGNVIRVPRPPLQSVSWIKYKDVNGNLQTVDTGVYQVDTYSEPGGVKPNYLQFWPLYTVRGDFNAVQLRYFAGYPVDSTGDLAGNVPKAIKQWILHRVAQAYEHREPVVVERASLLIMPDPFIDGLLDHYIVDLFPRGC